MYVYRCLSHYVRVCCWDCRVLCQLSVRLINKTHRALIALLMLKHVNINMSTVHYCRGIHINISNFTFE